MAVSERHQQWRDGRSAWSVAESGSQRIFRRGGVATESRAGNRVRSVDGAMGIPVGGWHLQRFAQ